MQHRIRVLVTVGSDGVNEKLFSGEDLNGCFVHDPCPDQLRPLVVSDDRICSAHQCFVQDIFIARVLQPVSVRPITRRLDLSSREHRAHLRQDDRVPFSIARTILLLVDSVEYIDQLNEDIVDGIPEVAESLIIGAEQPDGRRRVLDATVRRAGFGC